MKIIDLSLTMRTGMRGIAWEAHTTIAEQGWNSRTLHLYSHATTHMDAPHHFFDRGLTIDYLDLNKCVGPAWVVDLGEIEPRALIEIADLGPLAERLGPGDRILFKSGWSKRVDKPEYRDELPRISLDLAQFLADKLIALVGVEPPSVAAVDNLEEVTAVHQILLAAGIVIVEGLTNLDQLKQEQVTFIALPLKVEGGDGTPVRAIAIEGDLADLSPQ
jgi:kynurenine formamidase